MIQISTMGMFLGPVPKSWDKGTSSGGGPPIYKEKRLPTVRLKKIIKDKNFINIHINKIEEI